MLIYSRPKAVLQTFGCLVAQRRDTAYRNLSVVWLHERSAKPIRPAGLKTLNFSPRSALAGAITGSLFLDDADGVAMLDPHGRVLRANARFSTLVGTTEGELVWDDLPHQVTILQEPLRSGRAAQTSANVYSGTVRQVLQLSLLPVPPKGALLRVSDQTRERDLEDQLVEARRLQAVGMLAGGIGHDINNLLTAIQGATEDLSSRATNRPIDIADLDMVRHSAQRTAALVNHLVAFSKQEAVQSQTLLLNDTVRESVALLARLLGKSVTVIVSLRDTGQKVRVASAQMDQVLLNLAINAGHAMPLGGRLSISTSHEQRLYPRMFGGNLIPTGHYARLTVQDTGIGMAPDVLPHIFKTFFTTRQDVGGSGLGLSTVHAIICQSGGYMDVQSELGQGTCFDILLPCCEEPGVEQAVPQALDFSSKRHEETGRQLLLVDDDPAVRALAERALRLRGWKVITASSAEDALEIFSKAELTDTLDGVLSDLNMPGMDGQSLVQAIRSICPGLPAVLMSGYTDASLRRVLQAKNIRFLPKPFSIGEINSVVYGAFASDIDVKSNTRSLSNKSLFKAESRDVAGETFGSSLVDGASCRYLDQRGDFRDVTVASNADLSVDALRSTSHRAEVSRFG